MKAIWFLENVDLYEILCPYKYADHLETHPLDHYNRHDFLFLPNDLARDIYLIDRGKVKIGYYDDAGEEHVKAILGKGEILGEMALLGQKRHREFAEVMEDNTRICKLSVEKAIELTRDYKNFALELNKRIGERVRKLERRIEILLYKDARMRLVEFLKDLADEQGTDKGGKILIEHDYTQQDMASMIGTSRKTVSVLLNELEREGILKCRRKQIAIEKYDRLVQAATV